MKPNNKRSPFPIVLAAAAAFATLFAIATAQAEDNAAAQKKLRIVTSFLPIQSHAAAIAGEIATVEQLLTKDAGPHDFQLTPAAVRKLADADLFIINGAGMEDWLDELTKKAGNKNLIVVDTSKGVRLLDNPDEIDAGDHGHTHSHGHSHSHDHGDGKNPHIWLDPVIARTQAESIAKAL
ncbi:MAG: zinc ABC transporter substrate-binding protein, partial [Terrimicrobiaceae bacterium]